MSKNYEWHVKADTSKIAGKSFAIVDQKPERMRKMFMKRQKPNFQPQAHRFWAAI